MVPPMKNPMKNPAQNLGAILVFLFVVAGAARDVFFGEVFQRYRFFDIVVLGFGLATVLFVIVVALTAPQQFAVLLRNWRTALLANLGTACAWLSYFFALKVLEPAAVQTIHAGTGAVTLVGLSALGLHISRPVAVRGAEKILHLGVFLVLLTLAGVVLAGLSGVRGQTLADTVPGLVLAFASGVFISLTSDVTKRMHEHGVSAEAVLAVRFIVMVCIAGTASWLEIGSGRAESLALADGETLVRIAGAALALIVVPLYVLQLGLVRTSAVTTWVVMALGPCLVFALQALANNFGGRIITSPYTLACILAYSALVVVANLVRAKNGANLVRAKNGANLARTPNAATVKSR
jgi:drug/metabolite transporter (DMT)-like permease